MLTCSSFHVTMETVPLSSVLSCSGSGAHLCHWREAWQLQGWDQLLSSPHILSLWSWSTERNRWEPNAAAAPSAEDSLTSCFTQRLLIKMHGHHDVLDLEGHHCGSSGILQFCFSPVTGSSRTSFPPGLSTLAISARVSELWMEEPLARRQESTQSKLDDEWEAGGRFQHNKYK